MKHLATRGGQIRTDGEHPWFPRGTVSSPEKKTVIRQFRQRYGRYRGRHPHNPTTVTLA